MSVSTITKVYVTILFLILVVKGNGECSLKDVIVMQSETGFQIHGQPEWSVNIVNNCSCVQKDVKLNCKGFQTLESIDPSVLAVSGDFCLVENGNPVSIGYTVNFKYAWENSFPLNPISSEVACS